MAQLLEKTNHVGGMNLNFLNEHVQSFESLITNKPWNRVWKWKSKNGNDKHTFLHRRD